MMNPLILGGVLELGKSLLERFIPDSAERQKQEAALVQAAVNGELAQVMGQLEINMREAQNPSWFVSGWRPYFGWVCGTGFLYAVLLHPLLGWIARVKGWPEPPALDNELLWVTTSGLLGIGGLRTMEKLKKVAK